MKHFFQQVFRLLSFDIPYFCRDCEPSTENIVIEKRMNLFQPMLQKKLLPLNAKLVRVGHQVDNMGFFQIIVRVKVAGRKLSPEPQGIEQRLISKAAPEDPRIRINNDLVRRAYKSIGIPVRTKNFAAF